MRLRAGVRLLRRYDTTQMKPLPIAHLPSTQLDSPMIERILTMILAAELLLVINLPEPGEPLPAVVAILFRLFA
jgi:hypothetical protein